MNKSKIIVYHPGQQHSFKVAATVKKNGLLQRFFTAVYDKKSSFAMRLAHLLVRGSDKTKIGNRASDDLDDEDVEIHYTLSSLAVIVLSRWTITRKLSYWMDRTIADRYGVKVAKYAVKNNADAVICFSMNERTCFEYLQKHAPQIKRIVDCANAPVAFMKNIYELDMEKTHSNVLMSEAPDFWKRKVSGNESKGISATQFFLAPSDFVKKGLEYCGVRENQICLLPYGSNFPVAEKPHAEPGQVRFIYVGRVSYRKGMHYLLRTFAGLEEQNIQLDVVGAWYDDSVLYEQYKNYSNIHFHGNVLHDKVQELMMQADVFVFASLTEGLSLSCVEALSCGLPVICSRNAGANDLITDGCNGFSFEYDDVSALEKYVLYFCENKHLIPRFSANALETAKQYTWEEYQKRQNAILRTILEDNGESYQ